MHRNFNREFGCDVAKMGGRWWRAKICGVIKILLQPEGSPSLSLLSPDIYMYLSCSLAYAFYILHTSQNRLNMHLLLNFSNSWLACPCLYTEKICNVFMFQIIKKKQTRIMLQKLKLWENFKLVSLYFILKLNRDVWLP